MSYEDLRIASGTAACLSVMIQVFKNWKSRSSKDVSHGLIFLAYISTSLGIAYGVYLNKPAIYVCNSVLLSNYMTLHGVKIFNDKTDKINDIP